MTTDKSLKQRASNSQPADEVGILLRKNVALHRQRLTHVTDEESAYRRGFSQGVAYSIEAIDQGASAQDLEEHLHGAVADWRGEQHNGIKNDPPMYGDHRRDSK